ncbi:hypothetical protein HID58_067575, partial [Brassica napus]
RWYRHGSSNGTLFLRIAEAVGVKLTVTCSTTKNRKPRNIGVVSTDPKTELRKLRTKMHGYGMGPGSECSTKNWPRSPGELICATVELAGEPTGNTVVLAGRVGSCHGRAGSCHGRARRRVDRQHGRARQASWLVSRPSSPASRPATRSCSPGELARVAAELTGESTSNTAVLVGRAGSCHGRAGSCHGRAAGESTGNTAVLAGRAGSCRSRACRRVDRQHGCSRRASWLVSWSSSPGDPFRLFVFSAFEYMVPKVGYHSYTDDTGVEAGVRSSSPGEPTRVTAELAGEHNHTMVDLAGRVQPHDGSARRRLAGELTDVMVELAGELTRVMVQLSGEWLLCGIR